MTRRAFSPTPEQRKLVRAMAGYGIPQADICAVIDGIDLKTLRKHFRSELDTGGTVATVKVAENLYRMATGTGREAVTAAIFWMKTRGGWRETQHLEHTSPDGSMTPRSAPDYSALTPDELKIAIALASKITAGPGGTAG